MAVAVSERSFFFAAPTNVLHACPRVLVVAVLFIPV